MRNFIRLVTALILPLLGPMLTGCGPNLEALPGSSQSDSSRLDAAQTVFAQWRSVDEAHKSVDCAQLVWALTPEQGGRAYDYVLHEEEVNQYRFQQCRQAIQQQADALCLEASDAVLHPSTTSLGNFDSVTHLDKTCLAKVRSRLQESVLNYRLVKRREPFLVIENGHETYYNLQKLSRVKVTKDTRYGVLDTYTVLATFDATRHPVADDIEAVFADKAVADAFVETLTGANPTVKPANY